MKKYINSYVINAAICLFVMAALSSCVKSRSGETDFSNLQPILLIREGGVSQFAQQALTFPGTDQADTIYFRVNYAAKNVAPNDITVTLGYDENALNTYNSTVPASNQYQKMPDSIFSFTSTSVTIKAGQSFSDPIPFIVYPSKIDPTQNYMFPISILSANGVNISGDFGTIYYHLIGNPIAGAYEQQWIRYNAADTSGTPAYNLDLGTAIFAPTDPTTVQVQSGTGVMYVVTFTNTSGVLSNFNVSLDPQSVKDAGIAITGGPVIETADPIRGIYRFYFTYNNSAGSPRVILDQFVK